MEKRKKWATKDEAKAYLTRAKKAHNFGLSFCAACDFLGLDPKKQREEEQDKKEKRKRK